MVNLSDVAKVIKCTDEMIDGIESRKRNNAITDVNCPMLERYIEDENITRDMLGLDCIPTLQRKFLP